MNKMILFLLFPAAIFAQSMTLDNQTQYPAKESKMAIQWAQSAREVDEANKALMEGKKLSSKTLEPIRQTGKIELTLPKKAQLFRVLVWSEKKGEPDYSTNWVDITPDKTYTLEDDALIPIVLMPGSGC